MKTEIATATAIALQVYTSRGVRNILLEREIAAGLLGHIASAEGVDNLRFLLEQALDLHAHLDLIRERTQTDLLKAMPNLEAPRE